MFIFVIYECYFLLICYGLHVYGHLPCFTLISVDDINPTNFSRPSVTNLSSGLFCRGSNSFLYWYIQERNTTWKKNCGCIRLVAVKIQIVFCRDLDGNHVTRFIQWGCVVVVPRQTKSIASLTNWSSTTLKSSDFDKRIIGCWIYADIVGRKLHFT